MSDLVKLACLVGLILLAYVVVDAIFALGPTGEVPGCPHDA